MSSTVQATDGTMIPLDSVQQTIVYAAGFISTITVNYQGNTASQYVQTFTNNGTNITGISQWEPV